MRLFFTQTKKYPNLMNFDKLTTLTAETIQIKNLVDLDKQGFIFAPQETIEAYLQRVQQLGQNYKEINDSLQKEHIFSVYDKDRGGESKPLITFENEDLIPNFQYQEASIITDKKYAFTIDWIVGFYQNSGILFGGGTYFFPEQQLSIFVINNAFKTKKKWFIYSRNELLAHELCHVARCGFDELIYEEHFAYQTSLKNPFRRNWGGIVYSTKDTLFCICAIFAMVFIQAVKVFNYPNFSKYIGIEYVPLLFIVWLIIRHMTARNTLKKARQILKSNYCLNADAVLFRMSDNEIKTLAKLKEKEHAAFFDKFAKIVSCNWRFQIMKTRFWKA